MLSLHTLHSSNNNTNSKNKKENKVNNTTNVNNTNSRSEPNENNNNTNQSSYIQAETVPGTNGRTIPHITCYVCGKKGHYSDNCLNTDNGDSNEQHAHVASDRQPVHEGT